MKIKDFLLLFAIIILGFSLRIYGINWDQGFHMHPDERAIVLFALPLHLPASLSDFFSTTSPLNPHFFAYGSFPLYLLKLVSTIVGYFDFSYTQYEKINLLGRLISAMADTITIGVIFIIAKKLLNKSVGFIAAFLYTISVLSIQTSHFYAVDTTLTLFITLTLFELISLYEKQTKKHAVLAGLFFGLAIATKTSAAVLLVPIGITLTVDFLLIFLKQPHRPHIWLPHVPKIINVLLTDGLIIGITALVTFAMCEPYAFIDFSTFMMQTNQQSVMTYNAFIFPYTLQYVGIIPYWYEIKNIFLWGEGPIIALCSLPGILYLSFIAVTKEKQHKWAKELIIITFFWSYFLVVGKFSVGFMRYMLPLYPILAFAGAIFIIKLESIGKFLSQYITIPLVIVFSCSLAIWPMTFMRLYTQTNTRILATNWINTYVPQGSTLAIEHWDDALPIIGQEKYHMLTLPLYDTDTTEKWSAINQQLSQTDYIILASNRLYVPLQKLTDCAKLPPGKCYPITADYYKKLFSGELGFQKVAEFENDPMIPLINVTINDQSADESFTVYDHPKIIIFKKNK